MEPYKDDELTTTLQALRPAPRPAFAAELDARVAAGFPRESRSGGSSFSAMVDRVRALKPRQVLLPAGGLALTAIAIATVVASLASFGGSSSSDSEELGVAIPSGKQERLSQPETSGGDLLSQVDKFQEGQAPATSGSQASNSAGGSSAEAEYETEASRAEGLSAIDRQSAYDRAGGPINPSAFSTENRAVERSSELTLGTESENVGKASGEVFDVVHTYRGIVLRSQTSDGSAGAASAEFELLIPSAKLGDAMAAFSAIAEVRSRHEATTDITAPTVSAAEHLEDSKARIDSLLAQLAAAETESEREAVEAELRGERSRSAALSAQLQSLERRANLSRVSLRIESDEAGAAPGADGSWGIGDALHDAGRILAVAAAVTLVGLAVLGPIALIVLLAWLAHRAWVQRGRRQALG